jgi:hypothetical protein
MFRKFFPSEIIFCRISNTYKHLCAFIYTYIYINMYINIYMNIYKCIYNHIHIHTHKCLHINMYINTGISLDNSTSNSKHFKQSSDCWHRSWNCIVFKAPLGSSKARTRAYKTSNNFLFKSSIDLFNLSVSNNCFIRIMLNLSCAPLFKSS